MVAGLAKLNQRVREKILSLHRGPPAPSSTSVLIVYPFFFLRPFPPPSSWISSISDSIVFPSHPLNIWTHSSFIISSHLLDFLLLRFSIEENTHGFFPVPVRGTAHACVVFVQRLPYTEWSTDRLHSATRGKARQTIKIIARYYCTHCNYPSLVIYNNIFSKM